MNWFTRAIVAAYPLVLKQKEVQEWGGCEHVQKDPSLLYAINYENDSMGREGYCICEDCHLQAQKRRDEEIVVCEDCYQSFPRKDVLAWVPYDYYPRDGDPPIYVCVRCQTANKHLSRLKDDAKDRFNEFGDD